MATNTTDEGDTTTPQGTTAKTASEPNEGAAPLAQRTKKRRGALSRLVERMRPPVIYVAAPASPVDMLDEAPEQISEVVDDAAKSVDAQKLASRWSRRRDIPLAILAWAGVVILFIWLIGHIATTILLLVIAGLLAYALSPAVGLLERVMPRFLAILLVYLVVLGGIGGLFYLIVRTSIDQVASLEIYVKNLMTPGKGSNVAPLDQFLNSLGISSAQITSARSQIISSLEGLAGNVVPILTGVVSGALDVFLVAVLSIYLLIDGKRATRWLRRNMPEHQQGRVAFLLNTLQRVVGGYIRGQGTLCVLIGVLVGAGMAVIGVPYALLLGVLAFVLEFIPIIGVLVSGAICVLLALTKGWLIAVIVLAYFIVVHIIEGDVVGPRIVGRAVGLHPIVSIAALIAGGELFGIWGALLASPIAGLIQAFLIAIWSEWREMHPHEFQAAKDKVAEKVDKNVADKPLDPDHEPEAKLLS